jgi:hypothetical protein
MKILHNISLRSTLTIAFALLLVGTMHAQNITSYRYWFDDDIANLVTVPVTPIPEINTPITFNSAGLSIGFHTVTMQFKDADGHWSSPYTSIFSQKGSTLTSLEYWFNDEIASATQLGVTPAANLDLNASLDASTLPVGLYQVTMRGLDDRGEWSVPYTTTMTRGGGLITGYEYWIDDQVADRVMDNIGPANVVDLISEIPLAIADGDHTFTIRFHDQAEGWSVPITSAFTYLVGIDELPGVNSILMFPNPVRDNLTLRLDMRTASILQVSMLDASGRFVAAPEDWGVQGVSDRTWNTTHLAAGTYILRIISADHAMNLKFIKQ